MSTHPYLHSLELESFGAFTNKLVGPFDPTFTLVYGENGAGKTSIAQAIQDTLFGWQKSSALVNSYKPKRSERAVRLMFEQEGNRIAVLRHKNSEGLQGEYDVLEGLDKDTFQALLMLDSDELRQLKNTQQLESYLLTAGADTGVSPVQVLDALNNEFKELTSKSAQYPQSIHNLGLRAKELEELRIQYAHESKALRDYSYELEDIVAPFAAAQETLSKTQERRKKLENKIQLYEQLVSAVLRKKEEEEGLHEELRVLADKQKLYDSLYEDGEFSTEERRHDVEEQLEAWKFKHTKYEARFEAAQDSFNNAKARLAYAEHALQAEEGKYQEQTSSLLELQSKRKKTLKKLVGISVVAMLIFALEGLIVMTIPTLEPFAVLAGSAAAIFLGASLAFGLALFLLKRKDLALQEEASLTQKSFELEALSKDQGIAYERLQQEEEALKAHEEALQDLLLSLQFPFDVSSYSQAQKLIEQAKRKDDQETALRREEAALVKALDRVKEQLVPAQSELMKAQKALIRCLQESADFLQKDLFDLDKSFNPVEASVQEVQQAVQNLRAWGSKVLSWLEQHEEEAQRQVQQLYGRKHELKGILTQSKADDLLARTKLELAQVHTRLQESRERLVVLYLARKLLEESIDEWKQESQPRVYQRASEFLSFLTDGQFREVRLVDNRYIRVFDFAGRELEPKILSLGTVQQLYLSLRFALLDCAQTLAPSIPLIADDILVFFDSNRAEKALKLLHELSKTRQVILFTCHESTHDKAQKYIPELHVLRL